MRIMIHFVTGKKICQNLPVIILSCHVNVHGGSILEVNEHVENANESLGQDVLCCLVEMQKCSRQVVHHTI